MYLKKIVIVDFSRFYYGNNTLTEVILVEHIASKISEGSTVIGLAVVVSLPNNFYVFMYKDCILVRRS